MRLCPSTISLPFALVLVAAAPAADGPRFAAVDRAIAQTKASMMGEPERALGSADAALALAINLPDSLRARVAVATARWLVGEARIFLNQGDLARPMIEKALAAVTHDAPRTKLHGDLMRSVGAVAEAGGRMPDALLAYHAAYAIFTAARENRSRAMALQDIGRIYGLAGDLDRALRYYDQSAEIYKDDPVLLLTTHNMRGEVLARLGRLQEAEVSHKVALAAARRLGSDTLQVRVLTSLADTQIKAGRLDAAAASVARALDLARDPGAAAWRPFAYGEAARLADAKGEAAAAARYLVRAFRNVDLGRSDMEFREFHELAAGVFLKTGQLRLAFAHLRAFQRLDAEARALTASYGAQLASARFDFVNQNARISTLKARQLQQEVQLDRQRERMRVTVTGLVLAIAAAILAFLSFALITGRRGRDRLRGVNTDLERALKAKTEILAMTSHEIRTPLNGILGMTQVMLTEQMPPRQRERLRLLESAGKTMRALVDDILDVAKMETGPVTLVEEDVDLGRVLDDLVALWSDQARAKGVSLTCERGELPELVRVDPGRVRQLIFNLLSNAMKFTEQGSITLAAYADAGGRREQLVIAITDTGIGIDPAQQELIFEPFRQADASTTRRFGGTGLGLSICRKLAEAMGGEITVVSRAGRGSTFTLRFPLQRAETQTGPESPTAPQAHATSLERARVLLVDADPVARHILGDLLEPGIGALLNAGSGDEAMELLRSGAIDHLLVEAGSAAIVGRAGEDALRCLIAQAAARGVRTTVLLSAKSAIPHQRVVAMGADQIILKPVLGGVLLARLRELHLPAQADAAIRLTAA